MKKINISTKKYPNTFALVDDDKYDYLNQWKWHVRDSGGGRLYAVRTARVNEPGCGRKTIKMHKMVLSGDGFTDHINRDSLDNRADNLRVVTMRQNTLNTGPIKGKKYKGTSKRERKKNKFSAKIMHCGKTIYLGVFRTEVEAAMEYDKWALMLGGCYAYLNFPEALTNKDGE